MLWSLRCRAEHFSRVSEGRKGAEKGEEEGWPAAGARRNKGWVKTGQILLWYHSGQKRYMIKSETFSTYDVANM